jgi:hypothetical protein
LIANTFVNDDFLQAQNIQKGQMTLIDGINNKHLLNMHLINSLAVPNVPLVVQPLTV